MTSKEDFKQAIRTGNINEAFLLAMSNAPELSITTKIITAEGEENQVNSHKTDVDNYLRTNINLIEGKIENEIGEKLTGDRYSEIKQFHMRQVEEGHQTIQHNLVSLQKMFQLMSSFQEQNSEHSSWVDIAADVTREPLPTKSETTKLYSKPHSALQPGTTINQPQTQLGVAGDNPEPQLPSFEDEEEDEGVVDDLLSLADIDDESTEEQPTEEQEQGDWGEWLEDEPETKPEVFNLKSLNIKDNQNWKSWDSSSTPPAE